MKWINFILTSFCLLVIGCTEVLQGKRELKREYFDSGELKSIGWYVNDSIPVDSITIFHRNGKIAEVANFDSTGALNGLRTTYHESGVKSKIISYSKGVQHGFYYEFDENGTLRKKALFIDGETRGDYYAFNRLGRIEEYAFFWDDSTDITWLRYDSLGSIISGVGHRSSALFSYKTIFDSNKKLKSNQPAINVSIIVSNPPKCQTTVYIKFFGAKGNLVNIDSVVNSSYTEKVYFFHEHVANIEYYAIQVDSSLNKRFTFSL